MVLLVERPVCGTGAGAGGCGGGGEMLLMFWVFCTIFPMMTSPDAGDEERPDIMRITRRTRR